MIYKIPFYLQNNEMDCGPTALQMVLEFLGKSYSKDKLLDLVDSDRSGVTWTLGLAKSAAQRGFRTEFYTTSLGFNPENYKLDFYQKLADSSSSSQKKLEKLKIESVKLGVKMEEKSISLEEILSRINKDCASIVLLDWNVVKGAKDKGYQGHFVPIVGYDQQSIYVHNQGDKKGANFKISKTAFEEARKSEGTDQDIIFIYRN